MNSNRFTLAVHILTLMAIERPAEPTPSAYFARAASTNPVVVRRVLSQLHKARLVINTPGARGGAQLARDPEAITLLDVYQATGEETLFGIGSSDRNPHCICARHIRPVMAAINAQAHAALAQTFGTTSIAALARDIQARDADQPEAAAGPRRRRPAPP